ncbi:hypothetical protein AK812_SmicGene46229 [Symbiodinium microadriaticum]|uniref:Uncharacterized protein n=1 Tax=Symbiodinium microadriaticum TaxID=2951 RepID=A0A1Q9BUB7_SYMMI|nr:hypothetical protein AK812_SmicGene46229 [Symbiodinium microadriaticum]
MLTMLLMLILINIALCVVFLVLPTSPGTWVREARTEEFRRVAGLCAEAFAEDAGARNPFMSAAQDLSCKVRSLLGRTQWVFLAAVMEVSLVPLGPLDLLPWK